MNVITEQSATESNSLVPSFLRPYLKAIENIGTIAENITQTGVALSEAAVNAAELSNEMIKLRLQEVASSLSTRQQLT